MLILQVLSEGGDLPFSPWKKPFTIHRTVVRHAAWLGQAFAHCPIFPTAASRRSGTRVSVSLWLAVLSDQLPIIALVGRYPTNKLIGRRPLPRRLSALASPPCDALALWGISPGFPRLSPSWGQVTYALLTRPPLRGCPLRTTCMC